MNLIDFNFSIARLTISQQAAQMKWITNQYMIIIRCKCSLCQTHTYKSYIWSVHRRAVRATHSTLVFGYCKFVHAQQICDSKTTVHVVYSKIFLSLSFCCVDERWNKWRMRIEIFYRGFIWVLNFWIQMTKIAGHAWQICKIAGQAPGIL